MRGGVAEMWADPGSAGRVQTRVLMEHWRFFDFIKSEMDPHEHRVMLGLANILFIMG